MVVDIRWSNLWTTEQFGPIKCLYILDKPPYKKLSNFDQLDGWSYQTKTYKNNLNTNIFKFCMKTLKKNLSS